MKFIIFVSLISLISCKQTTAEIKPSTAEKPIVVNTEQRVAEKKQDTFIPIDKTELDAGTKQPEINESSTSKSVADVTKHTAELVKSATKTGAIITTSNTGEKIAQSKEVVKTSTQSAPAQVKEVVAENTSSQLKTVSTTANEAVQQASQSTASKISEVKGTTKVVEEAPTPVEEKKVAVVTKPDHSVFNQLLSKYVSNSGNVNYSGFKGSQSQLKNYIDDVVTNSPESSWGRNEKLAYWMNLYNAVTINLILDNLPLSSITDLDGGKPWDVKRVTVDGNSYSLNDIEHKIIRPRFKDPRIHFAVNCAAKSCPPIAPKAFTAGNVNSELDRLTKKFVNSSANKISANSMSISKIFEWYAEDFGDIKSYINKYSNTQVSAGADVSYIDYDWALNGN